MIVVKILKNVYKTFICYYYMNVPRSYKVIPIGGGGVAVSIGPLNCSAGPNEVLIKLEDSFGNFLGYKADTFWSLEKMTGKPTKPERMLPSNEAPDNLLYLLNGKRGGGSGFKDWVQNSREELKDARFDDHGTLRILAVNAHSKEELYGYTVKKDQTGRYVFSLS